MTCYENLANAIIIQAATDYKTETKKLKRLLANEPPMDPPKPTNDEPDKKLKGKKEEQGPHEKWEGKVHVSEAEIKSIEKFFYSQWFEMLSDADGPTLFRAIKKEAEGI